MVFFWCYACRGSLYYSKRKIIFLIICNDLQGLKTSSLFVKLVSPCKADLGCSILVNVSFICIKLLNCPETTPQIHDSFFSLLDSCSIQLL